MLLLKEETRDEINRALQGQVVPAQVGALLIQVVGILQNLPKQENDKDKKDEVGTAPKGK